MVKVSNLKKDHLDKLWSFQKGTSLTEPKSIGDDRRIARPAWGGMHKTASNRPSRPVFLQFLRSIQECIKGKNHGSKEGKTSTILSVRICRWIRVPLLLLCCVEEQNYELSPARLDNISSSLLFREQAIQTWMPNDPHSLFQIFYWKLYRYLTKKGFAHNLCRKREVGKWIHSRMIGYTLGHRQLHETPFLSDMQPFMAFFFQPPHKHLLRCTHIFWVVNSSVKGQSLSLFLALHFYST